MVYYAVCTYRDMIGPGLILKGGLVTRCGSLIYPFFATTLVLIPYYPLGPIPSFVTIHQLLKLSAIALLPRLRFDEPLKAGQTTIFSTLNGGLGITRPPASRSYTRN